MIMMSYVDNGGDMDLTSLQEWVEEMGFPPNGLK